MQWLFVLMLLHSWFGGIWPQKSVTYSQSAEHEENQRLTGFIKKTALKWRWLWWSVRQKHPKDFTVILRTHWI